MDIERSPRSIRDIAAPLMTRPYRRCEYAPYVNITGQLLEIPPIKRPPRFTGDIDAAAIIDHAEPRERRCKARVRSYVFIYVPVVSRLIGSFQCLDKRTTVLTDSARSARKREKKRERATARAWLYPLVALQPPVFSQLKSLVLDGAESISPTEGQHLPTRVSA